MSKLKELIQKLCPNGVEYKTIKETVGLNRGKRLTKSELLEESNTEFKYAVYHGSKDTPLGFYNNFNAPKGTTIVVNTGGIGGVKYIDKDFWCSDGSFWLGKTNDINGKYLYYCLSGYEDYFYSKKRIGGVPTIDKSVVENFSIPVPPLEVQEEIVHILDNFTELTADLTADLTAELTARKKQYEYYRNKLLSFNKLGGSQGNSLNNIVIMPLGEVGIFTRGSGLQKKDFTQTGVGCIHYGQIYTHYGTYANRTKTFVSQEFAKKARKAKHGDLIIATTSENDEDVCKAVAWLGDEDIAISSDACFYTHRLEPKYVAYYFQTEQFQKQKRGFITGTKVRRVNTSDLAKIKIPVPPIEEQRRIVSILDKFDMLATSISEGLPKEIELRRKQYEYYRNQLLSFPDNKATA